MGDNYREQFQDDSGGEHELPNFVRGQHILQNSLI